MVYFHPLIVQGHYTSDMWSKYNDIFPFMLFQKKADRLQLDGNVIKVAVQSVDTIRQKYLPMRTNHPFYHPCICIHLEKKQTAIVAA